MNDIKEKATVPNMSVGADMEQPISKNSNDSISDDSENYNKNILEKMRQMNLPGYMHTVTMSELYENVYHSRPPIIDGLLHVGTYLFVGAPKVGKSFLMAQLAYHVSTGIPLWEYPVRKGTVLYLALEDDYKRLQERLYRMFGTESTEHLIFSVCAQQLDGGLEEQLQRFTNEHPDTKLIIIDTLQKIRESGGDKYCYAGDYEVVSKLKRFADNHHLCLLLVHHTRKQSAEDKFDMISGTNGLLGSADGAFLLQKEKRTSNNATLDISGRDQQDQKLYLTRDTERLIWTLERTETDLWEEPPEPILELIAAMVTVKNSEWCGSPTELVGVLGIDMQANILTKKLNINAGRLIDEYNIAYENSRTHTGRNIKLTLNISDA